MKVEPYTTPNFAKSQSGLQMDIGLLNRKEFEQYCKSFFKKLKVNYNIRKKAIEKEFRKDKKEVKHEL